MAETRGSNSDFGPSVMLKFGVVLIVWHDSFPLVNQNTVRIPIK